MFLFLIFYALAALIKKLWHADRVVFLTLGVSWIFAGVVWMLRSPFDYLWIFLGVALLLAAVFNQKLGVERALVTATRRLRFRRRAASAGLSTTAGPATPTPPAAVAAPAQADSSAASTRAPSNPPPEAPSPVQSPVKAAEPVPEGIVWLKDFLSAPKDLRGLTVGAVERLDRALRQKLRGQDLAIETLVRGLRRRTTGWARDVKKPYSAIFVGPTGVGKTEMAEIIAKELDYRIQRYDMGSAKDQSLIWTLFGSPQGFVGGEGMLTAALRADPAQVVLFDEIEKADREMFDALMTMISEGRCKDRRTDQYVMCSEAILLSTSNLVVDTAELLGRPDRARNLVAEKGVFRLEFIGRLSDIIPFAPLGLDTLREIAEMQIMALLERVRKNQKLAIRVERPVVDIIVAACDLKFGARDVSQKIDRLVEDRIGDALAQVPHARILDLRVEDGEIVVEAHP